jgi:hypothetical protein
LNELSASCGGGWQTIDLHSGHLKASRGKGSSRRFFCAPNLFTQFRIRADVEVSELNVLHYKPRLSSPSVLRPPPPSRHITLTSRLPATLRDDKGVLCGAHRCLENAIGGCRNGI